ncbi:Non-motile and phage-resistance protein [compost metagenome]
MSDERFANPLQPLEGDDRIDALRGVLDVLFLEICLVAGDGTVRLVNAAWRQFARENQGDLAQVGEGANYLTVIDRARGKGAEEARRFGEGLRGVLEGRLAKYVQEYPCPSKSQARWFLEIARPLVVAGERFALVSHLNITERKLAERSSAEALLRLRRVLDTLPDIVYELDMEGRLMDWNRAFEGVTGYSREELKGRVVVELFVEEDRPAIARAIADKFQGGQPTVEGRLRTKDAQIRLYQWTGRQLLDEQGHLRGATGIGRDITAQRQAKERLKRSEAMLAEAQQLAHLGSWERRLLEDRLIWSDELFRIFGREPGEFTPTWEGFLERVCPEDRERVRRAVQESIQTRRPFETEFRILRPDGSTRVVLGRGRVTTDRSGQAERVLGTTQDITEVKALDQQIRLQYEELKELDRLKGAFVNSVSHELRTPLTSIMGYAEFLEDEIGGPLTSQQHQFVAELQRGAKRLSNLLNDLLDFARLEAGTFKLTIREADFKAKIREALESLMPQASEAKVKLVADFSPEPFMVVADHARLGQVLINLIGNAIKFTPPGGVVKVRACREGDQMRCEVVDTGIGIAPEDVPKLFRRFMQLEPGIRTGSGAGLGLSISKSIVDAHGGRIGVESDVGKGSTFWFVIPVQPI